MPPPFRKKAQQCLSFFVCKSVTWGSVCVAGVLHGFSSFCQHKILKYIISKLHECLQSAKMFRITRFCPKICFLAPYWPSQACFLPMALKFSRNKGLSIRQSSYFGSLLCLLVFNNNNDAFLYSQFTCFHLFLEHQNFIVNGKQIPPNISGITSKGPGDQMRNPTQWYRFWRKISSAPPTKGNSRMYCCTVHGR